MQIPSKEYQVASGSPSEQTIGVQLRAATMADVEMLLHLENTCFRGYYQKHRFTRSSFIYYLKNPNAIILLAVTTSRCLGYVLGIVQTGKFRHLARIHGIAVTRSARTYGAGSTLLAAVLDRARKSGAREVVAEVAERNTAARSLFRRFGFKTIRKIHNYYGDRVDALRIKLILRE